jgi:hypothetical protein
VHTKKGQASLRSPALLMRYPSSITTTSMKCVGHLVFEPVAERCLVTATQQEPWKAIQTSQARNAINTRRQGNK